MMPKNSIHIALRYRGLCAVIATACVIGVSGISVKAQVSAPAKSTTVDWSDDGRPLSELAAEAKHKGITTVLINRKYFAHQIEFPPLNSLSDALSIPDIHILLVRDIENVTEAEEDDDTDLRTWIRFSVVENLTGKPLDRKDAARTPREMTPASAAELVFLEQAGSLTFKGVTFIHSAPDLGFFRPNGLYLVVVWVSGSEMAFIAQPPAAFLVSATSTLHPLVASSPVAQNVRQVAGNSLENVRLFIAQYQSGTSKH